MPNLTRDRVASNGWRFRVNTFAEQASRGKWLPYAWLVYVLREVQEAVTKGGARIIINAPPRHGKSEAISHWLPTWFLDWWPERHVILTSYSDTLASKWGLAVRDEFVNNPLTWARLRSDKALINDWMTTDGGGMRSVGAGGSVTGHGGHLLLVDDPHKNWEEAISPTHQQKLINWFNSTFYTRAEPGASIIVIQTRWAERDLTGYLMDEHEDDWKKICLPAFAEEKDPLRRKLGEALCPERFPVEDLHRIKKAPGTGGSHMFAGLYQQRPAPLEVIMVKRDWFRRWTELPEDMDEWIQCWDLTFKKTGSSYVVGQVWGRKGANFYLADQVRERLSFLETQRKIRLVSVRWPQAREKLVEDAANGPAVIDSLQNEIPGLIGYSVSGSKEVRLAAVSGFMEAGNVWIPDSSVASWVEGYVEELSTFPNSARNDQVDTTSMALKRLSENMYQFDFSIPDSGIRANPWREFADAKPTW